jgi:hypothetical protein
MVMIQEGQLKYYINERWIIDDADETYEIGEEG